MLMIWLGGVLFGIGITMLLAYLMVSNAKQILRRSKRKLISLYRDQILVLRICRDALKERKLRDEHLREYTEDDQIIDLNNEVMRYTLDEMGIEDGEYTEEELEES